MMPALYVIETIVIVFAVLIVMFQIIIPLLNRRPIFPIFRKEEFAQTLLIEIESEARAREILEEASFIQRRKTPPTETSNGHKPESGS